MDTPTTITPSPAEQIKNLLDELRRNVDHTKACHDLARLDLAAALAQFKPKKGRPANLPAKPRVRKPKMTPAVVVDSDGIFESKVNGKVVGYVLDGYDAIYNTREEAFAAKGTA